jgi:hypothetical protein
MRAGPQLRVDACGVRRYGSVMPVCMQPVATLTLQTFAKVFLGRRFHFSDEQSLSSYYLTTHLAYTQA